MVAIDVVQVVARGADVAFVIDENAPFNVVTTELKEYLAIRSGLWSKGRSEEHTSELQSQ